MGADASVPRTTTVLFGPKVSVGPPAIKVFGHFLMGGEHSANSGGAPISGGVFAYAYGAGADVPILPFFGWRVQLDHLTRRASRLRRARTCGLRRALCSGSEVRDWFMLWPGGFAAALR